MPSLVVSDYYALASFRLPAEACQVLGRLRRSERSRIVPELPTITASLPSGENSTPLRLALTGDETFLTPFLSTEYAKIVPLFPTMRASLPSGLQDAHLRAPSDSTT